MADVALIESSRFIGRNFNNGEIIELVLRTYNGRWIPFQMVQLVMMHELAHNIHMNHSKTFWTMRNLLTREMKELWARRYTGEGFWGGGRVLGDLNCAIRDTTVPSEELKEIEVCGGTFRSRRKKRKTKNADPPLTWKETKDRRIEKRFGKNGQSLGEDENQRLRLEIERKGPVGGKPRVAGSKRGRELRAAAALARFGTKNEETQKPTHEDNDEEGEDEYEDVEEPGDALDSSGRKILDGDGKGMIRVCGKEDGAADEAQVKAEMEDLDGINIDFMLEQGEHARTSASDEDQSSQGKSQLQEKSLIEKPEQWPQRRAEALSKHAALERPNTATIKVPSNTIDCPVCTMSNDHMNPTCLVCANILDLAKAPGHWKCKTFSCQATGYVNAGDCGICGACGSKKA